MKRTRSILALLLILCLVLPMVPVRAAEEDALQCYLEECLTYYLLAEELDIATEIYYLSQGIEIAGTTDCDKRIYFLFDEKESVGMLLVTMIDGTYASNFIYGTISEVTTAYQLGMPIALYVDAQGDLFLWTSFGVTLLYGPQSDDTNVVGDDLEFSPVLLYTSPLSLEIPMYMYDHTRSVSSLLLDVPIVRNNISPVTGEGLCWAACVAAIGAYETGTKALTALEMYYWVDEEVNVLFNPHPVGAPQFVVPALELFGLDYKYNTGGMLFTDVKTYLNEGMPIYASLRNEADTSRHAVVICGYKVYPGAYIVQLMDPNLGYIVSGYMANGSLTISYVTASVDYTVWFRRYHELLTY